MKLVVHHGRNGKWYVRMVARNGEIWTSTHGYTRKGSAVRSAKRLRMSVGQAAIIIED